MKLRRLAGGILSCIPGIYRLFGGRSTGGTRSAAYCYEVWMKHLVLLRSNGMRGIPGRVAELGPADSLGVGLAALLSGSSEYSALDVVRYSGVERNLALLEELVELFSRRAPKPSGGWPPYDDLLDERGFPSGILTDEILERALDSGRLRDIRRSIESMGSAAAGGMISYHAPWTDPAVIDDGSADLILSHSVLEHVDDLDGTFAAMRRWLRCGGWISHQVDLTSHGIDGRWDGHRAISPRMWSLIRGRKPYLINRLPASEYEGLLRRHGFETVRFLRNEREPEVDRASLADPWRGLCEADRSCAGIFFQAVRRC